MSKRLIAAAAVGVVVVIIGLVLIVKQANKPDIAELKLGTGTASRTIKLERVKGSIDLTNGLSGRESLDEDSGMLFDYEGGGVTQRCMWMKDMQFDLDIIWLDSDYRVTSIIPNLTPATYPQSYCANAQYVVEIAAGQAAARGVRIGQLIPIK